MDQAENCNLVLISEITWSPFLSALSAVSNAPTGAVKVGTLFVARTPYNGGLWVGKLQSNSRMYLGLPDGSQLWHHRGAVQVIV